MISGCQVVEHSMVKVGVSRLRDRESSLGDFRRALRELAVIVGVEAARDLELREVPLQSPLSPCTGHELARPLVIIPILRAGLGMAEALLQVFPEARVGHVGLCRDEETFEPQSYYFKTPPLDESDIFLVDPMLATGQSAADAVDKLKAAGAKRLRMLALIGARPGVELFCSRHPDVPVFLAALDEELNDKAYIVPGLGDAGDRYFGT
ncbi:MAG: uracil phosphoribosyltransferase [Verrucomicrobiota bacterium]